LISPLGRTRRGRVAAEGEEAEEIRANGVGVGSLLGPLVVDDTNIARPGALQKLSFGAGQAVELGVGEIAQVAALGPFARRFRHAPLLPYPPSMAKLV